MAERLESFGEIESAVWKELDRAAGDQHHEWRTPVLATLGADGHANARTVVLRHVQPEGRTLVFFTDSRSPKVDELRSQPRASLVFWSKKLRWQLRLRTTFSVLTAGVEVDVAWERLKQTSAAGDYLSAAAPGAPVERGMTVVGDQPNFAMLQCRVEAIDWLELARGGHRRAWLEAHGNRWVQP